MIAHDGYDALWALPIIASPEGICSTYCCLTAAKDELKIADSTSGIGRSLIIS
jgi:hypothetical protein